MKPLDWKSLSRSRPTALALGNFDGVHLGHRRILEEMRREAGSLGFDPVALTFDPHPRSFFFPDKKTVLLTSASEKDEWLRALGAEVATLAFDASLAGLGPERFVEEILVQRLRGERFFLGPGHRFGKGAAGDAELLRRLRGAENVTEVAPVESQGEIVSSSAIRHHLKAGRVEEANRMLGRTYCLRGEVVRGEGRGRTLGFPTANLRLEDGHKALPAFGVYGGMARWEGRSAFAVGNIGLRPTFGGNVPLVEVHLLDADEPLYAKFLTFELERFLRPEMSFSSADALRRRIAEDVAIWVETAERRGRVGV